MHPYQLDAREAKTWRRLHERNRRRRSDSGEFCFLPFGDREVLGLASFDGFQLWIFNPDFELDLPPAEPFRAMEETGPNRREQEEEFLLTEDSLDASI